MLVNAVYFKGHWHHKFSAHETKRRSFYTSSGAAQPVHMMSLRGKKFRYACQPGGVDAHVLELPYRGSLVAMTLILPRRGASLDSVERQLLAQPDMFRRVVRLDGGRRERVFLQLPKFKLEFMKEVCLCVSAQVNSVLF